MSQLKEQIKLKILGDKNNYQIADFTEEEVFKVIGKRKCVNRTLFCFEKNKKAYLMPSSTFYMSEEQGLNLEEMYSRYPLKFEFTL